MRSGAGAGTVFPMSLRASRLRADAELIRDVRLRDGSTLRLQTPHRADFEKIRTFYDGLSWESRHRRFLGYPRADLAARGDADATGADHFALIGLRSGRVVASSRYDALREQGAAEISFAVADAYQGLGIGTRMLEQLALIAAAHGIHRFDAHVLAENRPMLAVFEHAGYVVRQVRSGGEVTVSLDLDARRSAPATAA